MHSRMVHDARPQALAACHTTSCLACGKEFHVRSRLLTHLKARDDCTAAILDHCGPAPQPVLDALLAAEKAARRSFRGCTTAITAFDLPPVRIVGPPASLGDSAPARCPLMPPHPPDCIKSLEERLWCMIRAVPGVLATDSNNVFDLMERPRICSGHEVRGPASN